MNRFKTQSSSNIWERHSPPKTACMMKLKAYQARECLLPLGPESFAIQFAIYKHRDYNFSGCVTLARNLVILGGGHRLRVFENRVLRDEVTGDWRKLHNKLRDLYRLPGTIRVIEWRMMCGACSTYGGRTATHRDGFDEEI
jgi:hypothetical protein